MESLQLRALNADGIEQMGVWLDQARQNPSTPVPQELLESNTYSEKRGQAVPSNIFDASAFQSKLSLAMAIDQAITASGLDEASLETDKSFWSWLTLRFSKHFIGKKGQIGEQALWIYEPGHWRKEYRQKMAGSWLVYRSHRDNPECLKAVLGNPVNKGGELFEQMMGRKWIALSPGIMALSTKLYFDEAQGRLKKGSGSKEGGGPRRLSTVLDQLSLTYDIEDLGWEALANMLPKDFKKLIPQN